MGTPNLARRGDSATACSAVVVAAHSAGLSQAGGPGGHMLPPSFGQNSYPYLNVGDRLCPPQYYVPPRISDLATALLC